MNYRDIAQVFSTTVSPPSSARISRRCFLPQLAGGFVDIGGQLDIWEMLDYPAEITLVNLDRRC